MGGNAWNSRIWIDNRIVDYPPYFLDVSPGWLETMRIPLLAGRDLTARDRFPGPAIINQAFAREYLDGRAPLGLWFETDGSDGRRVRFEIVGVAGDARYRNLREQPRPTIYVPLRSFETEMGPPTKDWATFLVRTSSDQPLALAGALRRTVSGAGAGFRVSEISTQQELVDGHTVRERMLATLSVFFAGVALLLAGVGLYGVMSYAVIERRREIGIRLALGARAGHVVRRVTTEILVMLLIGSGAGLAAGLYGERFFATLLFQASAREATLAVYPLATLFAAALLAALPPVARALRTDPATILRAE
jgi:hypothetical protein